MRRNFKNWVAKWIVFRMIKWLGLSIAVMVLWNQILVGIVGIKAIGFFEALGVLVLARILTGNLGMRGQCGPTDMMHKRGLLQEKWKLMNEAEKQRWMHRMGKWGVPEDGKGEN